MVAICAVVFFLSIIFPVFPYKTGAILVKDNYKRCKDVNLHTERLVCEIHSQEDEMKIERFGLSGCYGSILSCAEGDIKTCMPLMTFNTLHYQCYCHLDEQGTVVSDYYWTLWEKLNNNYCGFIYKRNLVINNGQDYMAEEYRRFAPGVQYVVANNSLPDSVFTASSYFRLQSNHAPARARLDDYFDQACAWAAGLDDKVHPWLKITLPDQYNVLGVYIKQRCDHGLQYPTVIDVTTSVDDVLWQDVVRGEVIATRYSSYDMQGSVSVWFPRSYKTRYWKIYISEYYSYPLMKCDLLSYVS